MKASKKENAVVIGVLILFSVLGFFGYKTYVDQLFTSAYIQVPTINTTVSSSSSDKSHDIQLTLALDIDNSISSVNSDYIHREVTRIVSEMDFEELTSQDGFDYLLTRIQNEINIDPSTITNIYIVELQYDGAIQPKVDNNSQRRKLIFEGLFPNSKIK